MALCRNCRNPIPCHCHVTPATEIRPGVYAVTNPYPAQPDRSALHEAIAALFRHRPGVERLGDATPGEIADAVLAVIPETADRPAEWRAAADAIESWQHERDDEINDRLGGLTDRAEAAHVAVHRAAAELRRMADEAQQPEAVPGTCGHRSSDGHPCNEPLGHLGYHRNARQGGNEWTSWVGDGPVVEETECCGAEPPEGWPGDCWCTLPSGHEGEHRCQLCAERHEAPGWTCQPAAVSQPGKEA